MTATRQNCSLRVLYVDTMSDLAAQPNVQGRLAAYRKVSQVWTFDYRRWARRAGVYGMNALLLLVALLWQPSLVQLGKCESVKGRTIYLIKRLVGSKVILFYGDLRLEPRAQVVDIGRYADITLLYHKDPLLIRKHQDLGVEPIGFWWVGIDPDQYKPHLVEKEYDVVFIANNADFQPGHQNRRDLIKAVADSGVNIHVFGKGWGIFDEHPRIHTQQPVFGENFAEVCSKARLTLGCNTVRNVYLYESWRRPFGCMACGSLHLTASFPGLDTVFKDGEHLVTFNTLEEAVAKVHYFLNHEEERERIAEAGKREVLEKHTWDHRIRELLQMYDNLKGIGSIP